MIDSQILIGVLVALAGLVGTAVALSVAMLAAARIKPGQGSHGQGPHGGIRRELPPQPAPDTDDARTLVLR
jgi:hypothetical protein